MIGFIDQFAVIASGQPLAFVATSMEFGASHDSVPPPLDEWRLTRPADLLEQRGGPGSIQPKP
jgi:hypothetical protein